MPRLKTATAGLLATVTIMSPAFAADTPRTGNDVEARVGAMLDNMTESEKINFTRVDDGHMIPPLAKFGIEGTVAYDSSMALHVDDKNFGAQYPSLSALAATWSINRAKEMALALGYETRIAGGEQLLSPVVNLYRTPLGGRAAETVSGEDPFLGAVLAPTMVNAIQRQGIQANGKHFLANNQEANRQNVDETISERALRELYLPSFESMVKNSNVASIMCGYNKINGDYSCENHHLITDVLKGEWGYQGFVLSDFNSIHDAFNGAWAGTDLDMPSGLQYTEAKILPLLQSGQLTQNVIDDKVRRELRALVSYGFDEKTFAAQTLDHPEYGIQASLDAAREAPVLLRNAADDNGTPMLPLKRDAKIAVIGNIAKMEPSSPFGTPYSNSTDYVSELSGLRQLASSPSNIDYFPELSLDPKASVWYQPGNSDVRNSGLKAEYYDNTELAGEPVLTRVEPGVNFNWTNNDNVTDHGITNVSGFSPTGGNFSARFTGAIKPTISGPQVFKVRADGAYKLWVNDRLVLENDGTPMANDLRNALTTTGKTVRLKAGKTYSVRLEYRRLEGDFTANLGSLTGVQMSWAALKAPESLADYDAVIVSAGSTGYEYEGESTDKSFDMPEFQGQMIKSVAKVNPNTVVVLHGGGGMNLMPWAKKVRATLHAWFLGQQQGQVLAEILYGDVNPSGKLPITLDRKFEDNPTYETYNDPDDYRGPDAKTTMDYSEGVYVGYRGYDKAHKKPLYPFGFGLSYTTFDFSDMSLSSNVMTPETTVNATFDITNSGDRAGYEVAQLYVKPINPTTDRPVKELKGFTKVWLEPGETKTVSIPFDARSLSYYQQSTDSWIVDPGRYRILIGDSSRSLPLKQTIRALYSESLPTSTSNPLPKPVQKAIQVSASRAY